MDTAALYNEPLFRGMNGNWFGLLNGEGPLADSLERTLLRLRDASSSQRANDLYSIVASGPGIFGHGRREARMVGE